MRADALKPEHRQRRKRYRERSLERMRARLCARCGNKNDTPDRSACSGCRKKSSLYVVRFHAKHPEYATRYYAGLCVECGSPDVSVGVRCERHSKVRA